MTGTVNTIEATDSFFVLGETLRPLLTNAMGSAIEIFDTTGPADSGPPTHFHPWEEVYVVLDGKLEVTVDGGAPQVIGAGGSRTYRPTRRTATATSPTTSTS